MRLFLIVITILTVLLFVSPVTVDSKIISPQDGCQDNDFYIEDFIFGTNVVDNIMTKKNEKITAHIMIVANKQIDLDGISLKMYVKKYNESLEDPPADEYTGPIIDKINWSKGEGHEDILKFELPTEDEWTVVFELRCGQKVIDHRRKVISVVSDLYFHEYLLLKSTESSKIVSSFIMTVLSIIGSLIVGLFVGRFLDNRKTKENMFTELISTVDRANLIIGRWINSKAKKKYDIFIDELKSIYYDFIKFYSLSVHPMKDKIKRHLIEIHTRFYSLIYEELSPEEFEKKILEVLDLMQKIREDIKN